MLLNNRCPLFVDVGGFRIHFSQADAFSLGSIQPFSLNESFEIVNSACLSAPCFASEVSGVEPCGGVDGATSHR